MKKNLLFCVLACVATLAQAINVPTITLTADAIGTERSIEIMVTEANTKVSVDWGDGNAFETATDVQVLDPYASATVITGTPTGDGVIKIYGASIAYLDCVSSVDGPKFTAIDISNATELQKLYVNGNSFTSLDLSKNAKLLKLYCNSNPLESLDVSNNIALTYLNCSSIGLTTLDVSKCVALETLYANDNQLTAIDLSQNTNLQSLYILNNLLTTIDVSNNVNLKTLSLNGNKLTALDVTACTALKYFYCADNEISDLKIGTITSTFRCMGNKLTFATLPTLSADVNSRYYNAPQAALEIPTTITVGTELDLSAQDMVIGVTDAPQTTTYTWKTEEGTALVAGEDYTENAGKFTFIKTQTEPVYCEMSSLAFPKFSGVDAFKTTSITVGDASGIQNETANAATVSTSKGMITVNGLANNDVLSIYTITGSKIMQQTAQEGSFSLSVLPNQYIVIVNGQAHKVAVN
ncbi:MAG: leucine-rich repeat domain-containing protein [Bacteroidaceae bacterium]